MADRVILSPKIVSSEQKLGTNVAAGSADFTFTAGDITDKNRFYNTGDELLIVKNTEVTDPKTITIYGVVDEFGRSGDITAYSLGAGEEAVFGPFHPDCFRQVDGYVWVDVESDTMLLAVVKLPTS